MARTDNDTWDLASSVGATATMVAAQRALANREGLIDDPFAEPLVRAVGLDFIIRALDGEIDLEAVDPEFNLRRAAEGMAVRTRHFDRLFTDAVAAGVRQAVILAAGLDARAFRLPWPDGSMVYEVDQPEVIEFKVQDAGRSGGRAEGGSAHGRRRPPRRLADGIAGQRLRPVGAHRVDRRGTADLSATRGAGPALRPHHRTQHAGQPGGHRTDPGHQDVLGRTSSAHPPNG